MKILTTILAAAMALTACASPNSENGTDNKNEENMKDKKILVAYFSRALYGHEAQNDRPATKQKVQTWLSKLGF